jgi:hypothetical protein
MSWKKISEHITIDKSRQAYVNHDLELDCYFIDFFENEIYVITNRYPGKSIHYVEDAAENYISGILHVSKTA